MPKITRRPRARQDLLDLWVYVAANNAHAADRLLDRIDAALALLSENPNAGRARRDLGSHLRSLPVGNQVLFYRPTSGGIDLIRVLSGYRDIDADLMD